MHGKYQQYTKQDRVKEFDLKSSGMTVLYSPLVSPGDRVTKRPPLFRTEIQVLPPSIISNTLHIWDQNSVMTMNHKCTSKEPKEHKCDRPFRLVETKDLHEIYQQEY